MVLLIKTQRQLSKQIYLMGDKPDLQNLHIFRCLNKRFWVQNWQIFRVVQTQWFCKWFHYVPQFQVLQIFQRI